MTPDHARLRALVAAYSAMPWEEGRIPIGRLASEWESYFAANRAARELLAAIPALLDEAEASAREIERLRAALRGGLTAAENIGVFPDVAREIRALLAPPTKLGGE